MRTLKQKHNVTVKELQTHRQEIKRSLVGQDQNIQTSICLYLLFVLLHKRDTGMKIQNSDRCFCRPEDRHSRACVVGTGCSLDPCASIGIVRNHLWFKYKIITNVSTVLASRYTFRNRKKATSFKIMSLSLSITIYNERKKIAHEEQSISFYRRASL